MEVGEWGTAEQGEPQQGVMGARDLMGAMVGPIPVVEAVIQVEDFLEEVPHKLLEERPAMQEEDKWTLGKLPLKIYCFFVLEI